MGCYANVNYNVVLKKNTPKDIVDVLVQLNESGLTGIVFNPGVSEDGNHWTNRDGAESLFSRHTYNGDSYLRDKDKEVSLRDTLGFNFRCYYKLKDVNVGDLLNWLSPWILNKDEVIAVYTNETLKYECDHPNIFYYFNDKGVLESRSIHFDNFHLDTILTSMYDKFNSKSKSLLMSTALKNEAEEVYDGFGCYL